MYRSYGGREIPNATEGIDIMFDREAGIYRVDIGRVSHFDSTWDFVRAERETRRKLCRGEHEHHWLQQEFFKHKLADVSFSVVEHVAWPRSTVFSSKQTKQETSKRGGYTVRSSSGTIPERVPGFDFQRFERLLKRRLEFLHVEYLKNELTPVISIYNRKLMRPKLVQWETFVLDQQDEETMAASMQIQRIVRGHACRCRVHRLRKRAKAPIIQRVYRGHLSRKYIAMVRNYVARNHGAVVIQLMWKKHTAKSLVNVLRLNKRRNRMATTIERVYRGYRGRKRAYLVKLENAVLRVQTAWRGHHGKLGYQMKQRALAQQQLWQNEGAVAMQTVFRGYAARKKRKILEFQRLERAVIRIQCTWRRKQGQYSYFLLKKAKAERVAHDAQMRIERENYNALLNKMAIRIQCAWRRKQGNMAYHMKLRAQEFERQHQKERDDAAHRIQMWWHHMCGNFAARFKARAEVENRRHEKERDDAAHRIQMWWHHMGGNLARRIKLRAEKIIAEERLQEERAALRIQSRWRAKKGQFAYHLKRKAIRELAKHVHDWIEYFDDWTCIPYWHSESVNMTLFEKPDNYNPDFSAYYEEYDYENAAWGYVNIISKDFAYILPKGGRIVDKPTPPKPPRTYKKINGYWRHKKRKVMTEHDKWLHKRDTLRSLVLKTYNYDEKRQKELLAPVLAEPKVIAKPGQLKLLPPIPKSKPPETAELIDLTKIKKFVRVAENPTTSVGNVFEPIKSIDSKQDLHEFLVRKYAKRTELHIRKKHKSITRDYLKKVKLFDRIKLKLWVGGKDNQNHMRYYPGEVIEVHMDGTYNLFLDDGVTKHDVRRDQIVFEYEEELPTPRGDEFDEEDDNLDNLMVRRAEDVLPSIT